MQKTIPVANTWAFVSRLAATRERMGLDGSFDSTYVLLASLAKKEMKRFPLGALDGKSFPSLEDRLQFILNSGNKRGFFRRLLTQTSLETRAGANFKFDLGACESLEGKKKIRFLDAGSGFDGKSSSSPNTLDTVKFFQSKGVEIEAVAVDIAVPDELKMMLAS
ncbi:MAG: hypothetical protein NTV88_00270 [Candidatus Micrarchaeota archaeon]|nr:hypothetical protein [Candidatus Micrarchaeota archaeon]